MTAGFGDVLVGLAALFLAATVFLIGARFWISTVADLIWITVLRPRLSAPVLTSVAFIVLLAVYTILPQRAGALIALPLFIALVVTPMVARPLLNLIARRFFSRLGYAYDLDRASLKLANIFLLEDLQQRTRYVAPETKAVTNAQPS